MEDKKGIYYPKGHPFNDILEAITGRKGEERTIECYTTFTSRGEVLRFNVTELNKFCKEGNSIVKEIIFPQEIVQHFRDQGRIEQYRIDRLTEKDMEKLPIICFFEYLVNGRPDYVLVDGAHRVVKLAESGQTRIKCHCLLPSQWSEFLLPIEEETLRMSKDEFMKQDSGFKQRNPFTRRDE